MSLYTDVSIITIDDITNADSEVVRIAAVENKSAPINLQTIVNEAIQQVGGKLIAEFQNTNYYFNDLNSSNALYGVGDNTPAARIKLGQIVCEDDTTTFDSMLKRVVTYTALHLFYLAAVGRKDPKTDKYETRLKVIGHQLENYWRVFKGAGLPIVYFPIPCPGAAYEKNTGTWSASNVTATSGGTASAAQWDLAISWKSGTVESYTSPRISTSLVTDQLLNVSIASVVVPANVDHWSVYAGTFQGPLYLQTVQPIGTNSFAFSGAPTLSGTVSGTGQPKDVSLTFLHPFFRG